MARHGLRITGITKSYGGREVLHGVSLDVAPGEIVGLLGPNGIGKSTTLRIAAGVDRPERGDVVVDGVSAQRDPVEAKRRVGYLPDVGGLLPRFSVWEHLELMARLHGLVQWEVRAAELLDRLGLRGHRDIAADSLSHGLSRRAGLALALLPEPPVLLVDEPFDGVDPLASIAVRECLAEAAAAGAAVVCSTHLLDVAGALCGRVAVMSDGRILTVAPTSDLHGGDLVAAYKELVGR